MLLRSSDEAARMREEAKRAVLNYEAKERAREEERERKRSMFHDEEERRKEAQRELLRDRQARKDARMREMKLLQDDVANANEEEGFEAGMRNNAIDYQVQASTPYDFRREPRRPPTRRDGTPKMRM